MVFGMPVLMECGSLEDNCRLARSLSLSFVELNMNFPEYQGDALDANVIFALKKRYCLDFTLHIDERLDLFDFNPDVAAAYRRTLLRAMTLAAECGMPLCNMHLSRGVYITLPDRKVDLYEKYFPHCQSVSALLREDLRALPSGPLLCIENTDGFRPFQKQILQSLLQDDRVCLTLDTGHSYCAKDIDMPFFTQWEGKLRHMHLHDARGDSNHLPLGKGEIPIREKLALAEKHSCRCVIEVKTVDGLKKSVCALHKTYGFQPEKDTRSAE